MTRPAASGQWTLGVLVGLPFAVLGALIIAGIGVALMFMSRRADPEPNRFNLFGWSGRRWLRVDAGIAVVVLLGYGVGIGIGYWPWQAAYHQYRPVTGTVATISSRIVSADRSVNQKFVITLTSGPQQYGVNDTRAALLHAGDRVALRCIRIYEYGSSNAGYDCKWGQ